MVFKTSYFLAVPTLLLCGQLLAESSSRAPDERFYPLVFRHALQAQAGGLQPNTGGSPVYVANFFTQRVGMSKTENEELAAEAQAWQADIAPVDNAAYSLIRTIRAQTPGGRLAPGQQPPAAPPELLTMQAQKDSLTLKHVEHLRALLGTGRFSQLDTTIRGLTQKSNSTVIPAQR